MKRWMMTVLRDEPGKKSITVSTNKMKKPALPRTKRKGDERTDQSWQDLYRFPNLECPKARGLDEVGQSKPHECFHVSLFTFQLKVRY